MLLATDEDFNNRILRGVLQRNPGLDIVRAQDVGLRGKSDAAVLEWAAKEDRILLSHDKKTMRQYVNDRLNAGLPMPGVFIVTKQAPRGRIIEDILILAECSLPREWENQIIFLPLK